MQQPDRSPREVREELSALLSLSGTMSGLCITGVTLFYTLAKVSRADVIADDLLALSALLFLLATYLAFWALRTRDTARAVFLHKAIDVLLAIALTAMVFTGFVMVYTVW